eukprot:scaffold111115_cov24-Prasinocladus_malaysianus.AAC.1
MSLAWISDQHPLVDAFQPKARKWSGNMMDSVAPLVRMLEMGPRSPSACNAVRALAGMTKSPEVAKQLAVLGAAPLLVDFIKAGWYLDGTADAMAIISESLAYTMHA